MGIGAFHHEHCVAHMFFAYTCSTSSDVIFECFVDDLHMIDGMVLLEYFMGCGYICFSNYGRR